MILTQRDYKNIQKALNTNTGKTVEVLIPWAGQVTGKHSFLSDEQYQELLWIGINETIDAINAGNGAQMAINSQVIDGKNIVRFLLPQSDDNLKEKIKTEYFEVPLENIQPLFTLQ